VLRTLAQDHKKKTLKEIAEETALPESSCSQILQVGYSLPTILSVIYLEARISVLLMSFIKGVL